MKLDEHICKQLSALSVREKVVFVTVALAFYCPSTLLRSFQVRSIIITTQPVPGRPPRLKAHSFAST